MARIGPAGIDPMLDQVHGIAPGWPGSGGLLQSAPCIRAIRASFGLGSFDLVTGAVIENFN